MTRSGATAGRVGWADLGVRRPLVVAPMAGGPTTPALVAAAAAAGALGFLAAGYKSADAMASEIAAVRDLTDAPFGVNVFFPGSPSSDPAAVDRYVASLAPDAEALGAAPGAPSHDDDAYPAKLEALLADPPPIVTFTFGSPGREVLGELARRCLVGVTVTSPAEAWAAVAAGAGALFVQGPEAGAHRGVFDPAPTPCGATREPDRRALTAAILAVTELPVVTAGGIATATDVAEAVAAGAAAAMCGTAFLRSPESGAHPLHKSALVDPAFTGTAVTRAFSGRPARGLVNQFMRDHADPPYAYPEVNNATRPLRAAAGARGDVQRMSLWAGTGYRAAQDLPAGEIIEHLCAELPGAR